MYTHQTETFPMQSRKGNRYIMILWEIDHSTTISKPICSRTPEESIKTYHTLMRQLKRRGGAPKKHILDNECSQELRDVIITNEVEYEVMPKDQHRQPIAERAIQIWRFHGIGVFGGFPTAAPLLLWDGEPPQIDM